MPNLKITYLPIAKLKPAKRNARTHSDKQVHQIARSIEQFGFTNPLLTDADGNIIAGHGRLAAATKLGMNKVPTIKLSAMTEAQVRAYVIADNKLAELAGWDKDILALEFAELEALSLDFELDVTGFEMAEIDILIDEAGNLAEQDPGDQFDDIQAGPAITQPGDIWQLGEHRLICGDATDAQSYEALLGEVRAQMIFTDPPYNVPIQGHVSGLGKNKHREFLQASGEMSKDEFTAFLSSVCTQMAYWSDDGSLHFVCMDWKHMGELLDASSAAYDDFINLCVWAKSNGGMGSLYRSQHELVFLFKHGKSQHTNNVQLGKYGRYRTNIWEYAGANAFGASRDEDLAMHPTVKPVAMIADAIRDCSNRNQIILDPFSGSGSTMVAAERTARKARCIELDPVYCDTIIKRMEKIFGIDAVLQSSGQGFAKVCALRTASNDADHENAA